MMMSCCSCQRQRLITKKPVELFHQDAIEPLTIPQSDLAVSDLSWILPLMKYKNYQTRAEKDIHTFIIW